MIDYDYYAIELHIRDYDNMMDMLERIEVELDTVAHILEYDVTDLYKDLNEIRTSIEKHCFINTYPFANSARLVCTLENIRTSKPYKMMDLVHCLKMNEFELAVAIMDLSRADSALRWQLEKMSETEPKTQEPKKSDKHKDDYER